MARRSFLRQTVTGMPAHIRIKLLRGDAGFGEASVQNMAQALGLKFIFVARLTQKVQSLCRHDEAHWERTEIPGLEVQEAELDQPGRRLIVIRQRVEQRPAAGGKMLLEVPGYRFQALVTNLPRSVDAVAVWRQYNGRADLENRIKELGAQFGLNGCASTISGVPRPCTIWPSLLTTCACCCNGDWGSWKNAN